MVKTDLPKCCPLCLEGGLAFLLEVRVWEPTSRNHPEGLLRLSGEGAHRPFRNPRW